MQFLSRQMKRHAHVSDRGLRRGSRSNRQIASAAGAMIEQLDCRRLLSVVPLRAAPLMPARTAIAPLFTTAQEKFLSSIYAHPDFDTTAKPDSGGLSSPYGGTTPAEMEGAYGVNNILFGTVAGNGSGQTIAIVDAYDYSTALTDLNAFSSYYGLPSFNNGGGSPTFTKYNENGSTTSLPGNDPAGANNDDWEEEESLDIEWAHSIAPKANIDLVETNSNSYADLFTGDTTAAGLSGVAQVSNSWGGPEFSGETSYDSTFSHTGVTFLYSSGDDGAYGSDQSGVVVATYPASSPGVVAVGGTSLTVGSGNTYGSETAWGNGTLSWYYGGGGGGISAYESQPSYQTGKVNGLSTTQRTEPDISLDANPNTGVPIYDSYDFGPTTPWVDGLFGGTSLACPMASGLIAIANQGRQLGGQSYLTGSTQTLPDLYTLPSTDFHDITSGNNGYAAGTGYDLATGIGSPVANLLVPALAPTPTGNPTWLSSSSVATYNSSSHILTVTGATTITTDPGAAEPIIEASGPLAAVTFNASNPANGNYYHIGGLSLTSGASAVVTSLASARTVPNVRMLVIGVPGATTAPTFNIDSTSKLDLTDNDMAILYGTGTSPLPTVAADIKTAYDNKAWDKPGITSSIAKTMPGVTALGYGEASTLGDTWFDSLLLGGNAVLVKYTLVGDANLDGTVNLSDYNTMIAHFNAAATWTGGSFDYSGSVGLADFNDVLGNFNQTLANVLT